MSCSKPRISEITYGDLREDLNKQAKHYINKSFLLICLGCGILVLTGVYYCVFEYKMTSPTYIQLVPAALSLMASVIFISFGAHFSHLSNQAMKRKEVIVVVEISDGKITPNELLDRIYKHPDRPLIYIGDETISSATAIGKNLASKK